MQLILLNQEPNDFIPNGDSPPVDPLEPTNDDEGEYLLNRHRAYSKIDFGGVNSQKAQMSVTWIPAALDLSNLQAFSDSTKP